ncbi:bifunctional oligoribonuclease/PAP phosphatase NrnA [Candidatus Peregrinibacteria bacterium]|nr:bifunctional oligoribonuclease/PAP phosphatase NrnA [Candidatus Peregrinibacteria bacterium]
MNHLPFQNALDLIRSSESILLVSHRRPDGDTLGACLGLEHALQQWNKKTVLACIDEIPQRFRFLPNIEKYQREFPLKDFQLIIICDAGASHMTGFHEKYPDFLSKGIPILNIDHHASNDGFGSINLIDSTSSSATMIVWKLLKHGNFRLTKEIGLALLTGIYNDTGGFIHANTTQETFQIAGELAQAGLSVSSIVRPLFKESNLDQLRLWGFILENLSLNEKKVAASVVSNADLKTLDVRGNETGGIIDLMSTIPDTSFTLLLTEEDGVVKGSLRTQRDDVSVADIAAQFGGGGHRKAAGFRIQGRLEQQKIFRIVPSSV